MDFFDKLYVAFNEHPTAALLVLALLALAFLFRDQRKSVADHAAQIAGLYEAHAKAMETAQAAHLQTAMQVAPLASKLVTCIEVLERLSAFGARPPA